MVALAQSQMPATTMEIVSCYDRAPWEKRMERVGDVHLQPQNPASCLVASGGGAENRAVIASLADAVKPNGIDPQSNVMPLTSEASIKPRSIG